MNVHGNTWAIVLAGGDGSRLRSLTTTALGVVPKQFRSLRGGRDVLDVRLYALNDEDELVQAGTGQMIATVQLHRVLGSGW